MAQWQWKQKKSRMKIIGDEELIRKFRELDQAMAGDVLEEAVLEGAELIREDASQRAPRRTGNLANNIIKETMTKDQGKAIVGVGPNKDAFYGCILGSRTYVATENGSRQIGQIKPGDKVLTQTGEYHTVIDTQEYPATIKSQMVDIEVEYRIGRCHKLTVTEDHKILVFRDGRNKWIPAKELRITDYVYRRIKKSWSEGTNKPESRTCEWCGAQYFGSYYGKEGTSQGKRFCSPSCYHAWSALHHQGMKRSIETKEKIRQAVIKRLQERPELHPSRIACERGRQPETEKAIEDWLKERGIAYEKQVPVGQSIIDFFLPNDKVIIEADGAFWHQDQTRDIERDKYILEEMPGATIIHIHFFDERFSKNLEAQPLPNVFYVACNPGPDSYVDPKTFEKAPIISLKHWEYKPRGKCPAKLYDLTVEGVHSFLAAGIIVSNSFVELGTSKMDAQPFLFPAYESQKKEVKLAIRDKLREAIDKVVR